MLMDKKNLIVIIPILIILVLILIGYLVSRNNVQNNNVGIQGSSPPSFNPQPTFSTPSPIDNSILSKNNTTTTSSFPIFPDFIKPESETSTPLSSNQNYQTLFKQQLFLIDIDYPKIYAYDFSDFIVKYFDISDLENIQIKEIYNPSNNLNTYNFEKIFISPNKNQLIFKQRDIFTLVDIDSDTVKPLPAFVKNLVFLNNKIILYISDDQSFSYLADYDWSNNRINRLRSLGILNADLVAFKNGIFIYEKNNPIFFLDLSKSPIFRLFSYLDKVYALLPSFDANFLLVSYFNNLTGNKQTIVMKAKNQETISAFPWAVVSDKCSFKELLICGVNDKSDFDPETWHLLQPSNDTKLVILNPQNLEVKEINLDGNFDVVKPVLTPLGIIFWNRSDRLFYIIKIE